MHRAHNKFKDIYKLRKKCFTLLMTGVIVPLSVLTGGCGRGSTEGEDEKFENFTNALFCRETASNTISLHYSLKDPEAYGIEEQPVTFGIFDTDSARTEAALENTQKALEQFEQRDLNVQNQVTYDVLEYYLKEAEKSADYILYEEPLALVSGVQTQLPVVLSEYQFYDRDDVDTYLALLETTGEYFDSLITFERAKSQAGLFMADYTAETVIEQCRAFLDMGDGNYLYSTFADRIRGVEELTEKEKSDYIQDNALVVSDNIIPAYEKLTAEIEKLKGTGQNEKGLAGLPQGKEYYELAVRQSTGSDRSVEEMKDLTRRQISDDLTAMEQVLGITAEEAQETAKEMGENNAELILNELEQADIRFNPVNRCYLCKKALFQRLKEFADSKGISLILEGTNEDDLHVYRPGLQAVRELGIISPLADAGFTKKEVRQLAAELGVSVADRPSTPCLATRLPYGAEIKAEVLEQIEKGEEFLKKEGFFQVRLRLHGEIARIEIPQKDFSEFLDKRERIAEQLKKLGFSYITLDIQGFRSGSMDENIKKS